MKFYYRFLLLRFAVIVFLFKSTKSVNLRDFVRLQTLPCHTEKNGENVNVDNSETSASFWRHAYCKEPLLVRSAAANWPAFTKWTDDYFAESAKSQAAGQYVRVEIGKKERRDKTEGVNMTFADFVTGYQRNDWYLVGNAPDVLLKSGDLEVPWFLHCNSSQLKLDQFPAIVLWASSGGTKSNLHFDDFESIFCVLAGSKDVLLLNPVDGRKSLDVDSIGLHSFVDVDNVDVERYQSLRSNVFLLANLKTGDCLYVPFHWLHQVDTSNERSLAVSFWFYPQDSDNANCYPLFDHQFSPIATKEITSALMKALAEANSVEDNSNTVQLSEDKFLEVVIPYLLPSNWSPPRQQAEELQQHIRSFFRQLVDRNHDAGADEEELLRITHSSIIWLFHLSRKMFDAFHSAQCTPIDLPMMKSSHQNFASQHQEL